MARILIIEDEPDIGLLYRVALEGEGHQIAGEYAVPAEVLAAAAELEPIDVIVLDERLRGVSGSAHVEALREAFPEARILLATADPDVVLDADRLGVDLARQKPFSLARLRETVAELLAEGLSGR